MRSIVITLILVFALACSLIRTATAPTDDPKEMFILSETQKYANILNKKITAEVTDEVYMVTGSNGSKVPAAGWYSGGHIKYWRTVVREYSEPVLTELAIHEVCHSQDRDHYSKVFAACQNLLRWYE